MWPCHSLCAGRSSRGRRCGEVRAAALHEVAEGWMGAATPSESLDEAQACLDSLGGPVYEQMANFTKELAVNVARSTTVRSQPTLRRDRAERRAVCNGHCTCAHIW